MATTNQAFSVPGSIRSVRLSRLPLSDQLRRVLRTLRVSTVGELAGISLRDFQRVSAGNAAVFREIDWLLQRAGEGECALPWLEAARAEGVRRHTRCKPAQERGRPPGHGVPAERPAESVVLRSQPTETIRIPPEVWEKSLRAFRVSVRLRHVLEEQNFRRAGDLDGHTVSEFSRCRNCGKKSLAELRVLVRTLQDPAQAAIEAGQMDPIVQEWLRITAGEFDVPAHLHHLKFADLPLSVRLEGVLLRKGIRRLGDVHGVPVGKVAAIKNCGKKTLTELSRLIERAAAGEFSGDGFVANPVELVRLLDGLVAQVPDRNREILLQRLGCRDGEGGTLEEVGRKFGLTRERVRQIVDQSVRRIRRASSRRLGWYCDHLEKLDGKKTRPFTPAGVKQWLENSSAAGCFSPAFYVRLLAALRPTVLARHSVLTVREVAKAVLQASNSPLTPEEILARAPSIIGADEVRWAPSTVAKTLSKERDFHLLGPRSFGLRHHFRPMRSLAKEAREHVYRLLKAWNRPASTAELLAATERDWTRQFNRYELAHLLRRDDRFSSSGRLCFGLSEWG